MEHFDVLIVGAGVSGLGAACHLRAQCPNRSFVILDDHASFGGTWHTHKFPGIRSDSDLYTYGYRFKPWIGPPIATAPKILAYLAEVTTRMAWPTTFDTSIGRRKRVGAAITISGP